MDINNKITPKVNPSFYGIQKMCKLGAFSNRGLSSAKAAEDAFKRSELLQRYCSENDVQVIFNSDCLKNCLKNLWYATMEIHKIFPKEEPKGILGKIVNLFKKKPREAIVIQTYGDTGVQARNKLAEFIGGIKTEKNLNTYLSFKSYHPVEMQKCRYCGWNKQ